MERNSLSASFKDHILNGTVTTNSNKNQMMKESWDCNNSQISSGGDEYMNGFSWPPRSYACSFCKREFRSAQALGGHMNVHRRDRARLRQSPPTTTDGYSHMLNLNLSPTSGPSFSSTTLSLLSSPSSSSTMLKKPFSASTFPSLFSPTLSSSSRPPSASPSSELKKWAVDGILSNPSSTKASESTKLKNVASLSGFGEYDDAFAQEDAYKVIKKAEIIRLDLEIGLLSDSKDDLDLELRLGTYS